MSRESPLSFEEIITDLPARLKEIQDDPTPIHLLLDHPELPRNIAAISRLADAARIERIYIFGNPPSEKKQKKSERVSRNAIKKVPIEYLSEIEQVQRLCNHLLPIALEYTNTSIPFIKYEEKSPCLLVIGNERSGVSPELLSLCKVSLHVPMLGQNSSMNVSVATGIVVYHLLNNMDRLS